MYSLRKQQTISSAVAVSGFGYWSGEDVRLEFRPAPADTGIQFVRSDLPGNPRIPAAIAHRTETPRRTTLSRGAARVEMVEHALAALVGLRIDNCEVWVDRPEMPGMDGSGQAFVEALKAAGTVTQSADRSRLIIREVTRLADGQAWIEAHPPGPQGELRLRYRLDYGQHHAIGRQTFELPITPETFCRELAASRTFMLKEEADWLLAQGLGSRATTSDLLVFGPEGPIDNELRFEDECVRHKLLDLVGDLGLSGCDIAGRIVAYRSGHRLNAEMVRALLAEGEIVQPRRRSA